MKFQDCFIDENGKIWKAVSLIEAAKDLPIFQFDISTISLDEVIRWKLVNVRDYVNHYQRVCKAELLNPLILRSDGYVMNGWHRIIKAISVNLKHLPAKQFKVDPEPDFKANEPPELIAKGRGN